MLTVPPAFHFVAGQYLVIELPAGQSIALSIASAPTRLPELQLHYRSTAGMPEAALFDALLASADELRVQGPFGDVCVQPPLAQPLLLVAGGTGGAQALGILDALLDLDPEAPVTFLWCADSAQGHYRRHWLGALQRPWLTSRLIVDPSRNPGNRALRWLRDHGADFVDHRVILCGSPGFVYAATDTLVTTGIAEQRMEADVFSYAPRQPPDTA